MKKKGFIILSTTAFAFLLSSVFSCKEEEPVNMAPNLELHGTEEIMRKEVIVSASIAGNLNQVSSYGVQYSLSEQFPDDQTTNVEVGAEAKSGTYTVNISGLTPNTRYYYRAFASTGASEVYSFYDNFTTLSSSAPQVEIMSTDSISENSISFTCRIDEWGNEKLLEHGVQYREYRGKGVTNDDPYIPVKSETVIEKNEYGTLYQVMVTGLEPATEYEFRAYAKNSETEDGSKGVMEGYGSFVELVSTEELQTAEVETQSISDSNIGITSITISGKVTSANGSGGVVDECGFCYSATNSEPTLADNRVTSTFTALNEYFTATITGLSPRTTYYVRAYAKNTVNGKQKEGYGDVFEVITSSLSTPYMNWVWNDEWSGYAETTANSIHAVAEIENYDQEALAEKGLIWSKTVPNITLEEAKTANTALKIEESTKSKNIDGTITGLEMGTNYYVRAYAIYKAGDTEKIGYSDYERFRTAGLETPILEEFNVADITYNSANFSCVIASEGNGKITEKGFLICNYSEVSEPTLETKNTTKIEVKGTEFSATATALKYITTYLARAYVITELAGQTEVVYSNMWQFTTNSITDATFYATQFDEDASTYNSLTVSSGIMELGDGELIERGFYWYDYHNSSFEKRDSLAVTTGTDDEYSLKIEGLSPNTYYYVVPYAKKKAGDYEVVSYSNYNYGAWTKSATMPTFTDLTAKSESYTTISMSSGITAIGDGTLTEKGFCWKQGDTPTLDDCTGSIKVDEGTNEAFSATAEGLIPGYSYYVRAYAKVKIGEKTYNAYSDYHYLYTKSLEYNNIETTPLVNTCDIKVSFVDNEAAISNVYIYVSEYGSSTSDISQMTKYTLTKEETGNVFIGTLDNLKESTQYNYYVYYVFGDQEINLTSGYFYTNRVPSIDDIVSPGKKE